MILNCRANDALREAREESLNLIFCDPPYQLGTKYEINKYGEYIIKGASTDFMNKWAGITPAEWKTFFIEAMRAMKYGGYIAMFGMEENGAILQYYAIRAGFEICQSLAWYNISGFPKALDISQGIDKALCKEREVIGKSNRHGGGIKGNESSYYMPPEKHNITAPASEKAELFNGYKGGRKPLKPCLETIYVFRKPLKTGGMVSDILQDDNSISPACLNIDGTRIISSTAAYTNGDNTGSIDPSRIWFEFVHKLRMLEPFSLCGTFEESRRSSDVLYVQNWYISLNSLDGCQVYRRLYDVLLPLFQAGVQVSVQQLHDVLDGISHLRKVSNDSHGNQCTCRLSSLGDFHELVSWYISSINYNTTPALNCQGRYPPQLYTDTGAGEMLDRQSTESVSRILHKCDFHPDELVYYSPKVSNHERNAGCDKFDEKDGGIKNASGRGFSEGDPYAKVKVKNNHPTLKPMKLIYQLLKLFKLPVEQSVFIPFSGAGSEVIAAHAAGYENILACELSPEYIEIATARLEYWKKNDYYFLKDKKDQVKIRKKLESIEQSLFD